MPVSALMLALAAACVHSLWNVLLARSDDPQAATAVALLVAEVVFAPAAILLWHVEASAWPYVLASGALELLYFGLLVTAYRLAPLSVVYPIARGAAPVLVLLIGVVLLGRGTSAGQIAGVCLVGAGVVLVRGLGARDGPGTGLGLAIACVIATYTLVDKGGVARAAAIPYLELSMLLPAVVFASVVGKRQGVGALRAQVRAPTVVAGIATFGAYALVLLALQRASAPAVAAVRETSVVITALLARRVLREPVGWPRLAGATAVAVGIGVLSLT